MRILLFLVSLLWIAAGAALILNTAQMRDVLAKLLAPGRLKAVALLPLALGAVLFFGSFTLDRLFWWALLIGAAALAKGLFLLRSSPERAARLVEWWLLRPEERILRLWGIVALVFGTVLLTQVVG